MYCHSRATAAQEMMKGKNTTVRTRYETKRFAIAYNPSSSSIPPTTCVTTDEKAKRSGLTKAWTSTEAWNIVEKNSYPTNSGGVSRSHEKRLSTIATTN